MILCGHVDVVPIGDDHRPYHSALVLTFTTEAMAGIRGMEKARFIVVAVGMILILRFAPGGLARIWKAIR